jgi:hypothetical protein
MGVSPETTSGGNALKFAASQRIDIRRKTSAADTEKDADGNVFRIPTTVKFVKNKLFPPFRVAHIDMEMNVGINRTAEILDLAADNDIILKSGAWYEYVDPSRTELLLKLRQHEDVKALIQEIKAAPKDFNVVPESIKEGARKIGPLLDALEFDDKGWRVQGRSSAIEALGERPELLEELRVHIREIYFPTSSPQAEVSDDIPF